MARPRPQDDAAAAAFAELYRLHHQPLYRYCLSILRHEQDAQDALQNTMVKAHQELAREQHDLQLRPWLFRVAHNECISLLRRRRQTSELAEDLPAAATTEQRHAEREELRQLEQDLAELSERQRSALVLRELSGLSHEEISVVLDVTPAIVKSTIFEARSALLQCREGREMSCASVRAALSDGDKRVLRGRRQRAHLRDCAICRAFQSSLAARPGQLAALAPPLPAASAAAILQHLLGGAGAGSAAAGAVAAGGSAGSAAVAAGGSAGSAAVAGSGSAATVAALAGSSAGGAAVAGTSILGGVTAKIAATATVAVLAAGGTAAVKSASGPGSAPAERNSAPARITGKGPLPAAVSRSQGPAFGSATGSPQRSRSGHPGGLGRSAASRPGNSLQTRSKSGRPAARPGAGSPDRRGAAANEPARRSSGAPARRSAGRKTSSVGGPRPSGSLQPATRGSAPAGRTSSTRPGRLRVPRAASPAETVRRVPSAADRVTSPDAGARTGARKPSRLPSLLP